MKQMMLLLTLLLVNSVFAKPLEMHQEIISASPAWIYTNSVRVGTQEPDITPVADILYLEGFGDRLDNHKPLFDEWVSHGFRVIAFDYPSHGETTGTSLNLYGIKGIAGLAKAVEEKTRVDAKRPLFLAGWSTGGLVAVRMAQSVNFPQLGRPLAGLILFAPGISVYNFGGGKSFAYPLGHITDESLTHDPNPPHTGPAVPAYPLRAPFFAVSLKINSWVSQFEKYPLQLPTQIFMSDGDGDLYADSKYLREWIQVQDTRGGVDIVSVTLPGARHEIDNETEAFGGPQSRKLSSEFALGVLGVPPNIEKP